MVSPSEQWAPRYTCSLLCPQEDESSLNFLCGGASALSALGGTVIESGCQWLHVCHNSIMGSADTYSPPRWHL